MSRQSSKRVRSAHRRHNRNRNHVWLRRSQERKKKSKLEVSFDDLSEPRWMFDNYNLFSALFRLSPQLEDSVIGANFFSCDRWAANYRAKRQAIAPKNLVLHLSLAVNLVIVARLFCLLLRRAAVAQRNKVRQSGSREASRKNLRDLRISATN